MSMPAGLAYRDAAATAPPVAGGVSPILRDPTFQELARSRSAFGWTLSAVMLVIYLGFILLVAFAHGVMATPVFAGGTTSLGIVLGLGVIIAAFVLTGIYVARANGRYDAMTRELQARYGKAAPAGGIRR
ncbi:DUF485 domain-containing protein [Roseomonas elaeocarpi]|uniref:DUF485 domain-containing protein n=1 Tax=Roseomonas elaeocarpi TaxID=907779 RepID=A0ABV6JSK4_9PROT